MPIERSCLASWNHTTVAVTARVVPRYAWTSASIDVAVGDETILKTGGVLKVVGKHVETFGFHGTTHTVECYLGQSITSLFSLQPAHRWVASACIESTGRKLVVLFVAMGTSRWLFRVAGPSMSTGRPNPSFKRTWELVPV